MKKTLVGACPVCGARTEISLSKFLESPVDMPRECVTCATLLQVAPKHPTLSNVVGILSYLISYSVYWYFDRTAHAWGIWILSLLLVGYLVSKTIGRPTLVTFKPERDFLEEEMSSDEKHLYERPQFNTKEKSNKTLHPTSGNVLL